jgi:hypothetical protein
MFFRNSGRRHCQDCDSAEKWDKISENEQNICALPNVPKFDRPSCKFVCRFGPWGFERPIFQWFRCLLSAESLSANDKKCLLAVRLSMLRDRFNSVVNVVKPIPWRWGKGRHGFRFILETLFSTSRNEASSFATKNSEQGTSFPYKNLNYLKAWKKFLQTHSPITKAIRFFHTLFAQHVSTLNWVLFGCFFTLQISNFFF